MRDITPSTIKFKALRPDAVLPEKATTGSAGLDLIATSSEEIENGTLIEYGTGLAVEIPPGHVGLLFPRSSVSKMDLSLANSVGVIDSDYRGEIRLRFRREIEHPGGDHEAHFGHRMYYPGERVAQLLIVPVPLMAPVWDDDLSKTERGAGAFGSTGS